MAEAAADGSGNKSFRVMTCDLIQEFKIEPIQSQHPPGPFQDTWKNYAWGQRKRRGVSDSCSDDWYRRGTREGAPVATPTHLKLQAQA